MEEYCPITQAPGPANNNSLPDELIERIMYEAWYTISPPNETRGTMPILLAHRYRWHFYTTLTNTSHNFRRIALDLPYRIAVFRNSGDAYFYKFLLNGRISGARNDRPDEDVIMKPLFKSTTVLLNWTGDADDYLLPASHQTGPFTKFMGHNIIPDAKEVIIDRWGVGLALEEWIFNLKSLIRVRLNISDITQHSIPHATRPSNLDGIPSPLAFTKWHANQTRTLHAVEISGSLPKFTVRALDIIIKAQQITLLTKQSLKIPGMSFQNAVRVLILDTPPEFNGLSDISQWRIPAAVRAGLSCPIRRKSERLNIIVRGSAEVDPVEWHEAETACASHDVKLTLQVVYQH